MTSTLRWASPATILFTWRQPKRWTACGMTFHPLSLLSPSLAFKAIRRPLFTIAAPIFTISGMAVCPSYFSLRATGILRCPLTRTLSGCSEKKAILPSPLQNRKNPFTQSSVLLCWRHTVHGLRLAVRSARPVTSSVRRLP